MPHAFRTFMWLMSSVISYETSETRCRNLFLFIEDLIWSPDLKEPNDLIDLQNPSLVSWMWSLMVTPLKLSYLKRVSFFSEDKLFGFSPSQDVACFCFSLHSFKLLFTSSSPQKLDFGRCFSKVSCQSLCSFYLKFFWGVQFIFFFCPTAIFFLAAFTCNVKT